MKTLIIEELTSYTMQVPDDLPDTDDGGVLTQHYLNHIETCSGPELKERYCYCDL